MSTIQKELVRPRMQWRGLRWVPVTPESEAADAAAAEAVEAAKALMSDVVGTDAAVDTPVLFPSLQNFEE